MKRVKALSIVIMFALLSSGCAVYNLQKLRHTTPTGTPFQSRLARLYMDFAIEKERRYDWYNSMYFAGKGLRAAYGKDVGPEELKDWNIPANRRDDLEKARAMLVANLTADNIRQHSDTAAQAQVYFDCWVEYQEANWQEEDIVECRNGLARTLSELAGIAPVEVAQETSSYVVFFVAGQAELSDTGKMMLDEIFKSLEGMDSYQIVLNDHADSSGKKKKPMSTLAKARAATVKQRLMEGGVKESAISISSAAPSSATHRVEIYLNE